MNGIFTLNWQDILKGLIMTVGSAVLTLILSVLHNGGDINWALVGTTVAIAVITYLLKNFFTDNQGKFLGKF